MNLPKVTLGEIAEITSGGTPDRSNKAYWGGSIPWVKTAQINNSVIRDSDIDEWITEEGIKNSSARMVPEGTILMAMYGQGKTRGQVAILGLSATINQACAAIQLSKNADRDYIFQQLLYRYKAIRGLSNTGSQENLSAALIKEIIVPFPEIDLQRSIASILAAWDRAISLTERLIAAKEERRKWLMQQLLTGKRRLKGFKKPWKEVRIGAMLREVKRPVAWDDKHLYRLISVRRRSEGLFLREPLYGSEIKTKKMNITEEGDFLISKMQIVHGAAGLVSGAFAGLHISDSYIILRSHKSESLDIRFFNWVAKLPLMYHHALFSSYGVHIEKMTFNLTDYLKRRIHIPTTLEEQRAIVNVLAAADQELDLLHQKLDALREQKKGLMQQLLTGKIRVKVK